MTACIRNGEVGQRRRHYSPLVRHLAARAPGLANLLCERWRSGRRQTRLASVIVGRDAADLLSATHAKTRAGRRLRLTIGAAGAQRASAIQTESGDAGID